MSSVRQIAKRTGYSISTVSRALNHDPCVSTETRERVLAAANRSGYAPSVGRLVTTNIGFAYTQERTISHPYDAAVLEGAARGLDESRFDLMLLNIWRDKRPDESFTGYFRRKGVRGVLLRTMAATRNVVQQIADEGFPHVVISERFDEPGINWIDSDSHADSVKAVEYLISLGHKRIGFGVHNVSDRDHLDRLEGYRKALQKHAIPYDESLVLRYPFTIAGGATAMRMAAALADRPTAIYLADPMMSVGAMKAAMELGLSIPKDLSIVGFDDTDVRFGVHPTLTSVCQNADKLGYEAALWLCKALTQESGALQKTIPTYFEVNESTAPPGNAVN